MTGSRKGADVDGGDRSVVELELGGPLHRAVVDQIAGLGLGPEFLAPPAVVLVAVEGSRPEGLCVLHDMRDPAGHVGTAFDMDAARQLLGMTEVGLYRIALVHSAHGADRLGAVTERLLEASTAVLWRRFARHALVIPLMKRANRLAFPLWARLGFKQRGLTSYQLATDLRRYAATAASVDLSDSLDLCFFDGMRRIPRRGLVRCYARVFLARSEVETAERVVSGILGSEGFAPGVSFLVRRKGSGRIVGFLLAEREGPPAQVNVTVAGLLPSYRARGVPMYGFPRFAERCLERGITTATQMTSTERVVKLLCAHLGAEVIDELVWLIRAR